MRTYTRPLPSAHSRRTTPLTHTHNSTTGRPGGRPNPLIATSIPRGRQPICSIGSFPTRTRKPLVTTLLPKPGDRLSHYKRTACALSTCYQCPFNHLKATAYHSPSSLTPPPATTLLVQPCAHRPRLPVAQRTRYTPPLCSTGFLKSLLTQRKHGGKLSPAVEYTCTIITMA